MKTVNLVIDNEGKTCPDEKGRPVRCALTWKDKEQFENTLVEIPYPFSKTIKEPTTQISNKTFQIFFSACSVSINYLISPRYGYIHIVRYDLNRDFKSITSICCCRSRVGKDYITF
jgi:hypothetical protein